MHVFALNGIRHIIRMYSPHGLQLSRRYAWISAWMRLGYMQTMHEFIEHEHLSMARAGSSDPEPPVASTATLPMLGAPAVTGAPAAT